MSKEAQFSPQQFVLPWGFPTLNDLLQITSQHWSRRSKAKKQWETIIALKIRSARLRPTIGAVHIGFKYIPLNRRQDPDNCSCVIRKYTLDALQREGIIEQDNWSGIIGLHDDFASPDKHNPRVIVTLRGEIK